MRNSLYLLQEMMEHRRRSGQNSLMQHTPFGYMWVSVNTKKLVASHTIYSLLEKEPYEEFFTIDTWRSFVHQKDLYKLLQAEEDLLHNGKPVSVEYRLITGAGRHIFVRHHMTLSGSPNMEKRIMSLVQDITHEKSADIILETMNEGFFELNEENIFRRINEHAIKFWQLEHQHPVGKHLTDIFPQIEGTPFYKILAKAQARKISLAQDVPDPITGHWLHVSVTPYSDGLIVIFYDINNEKESEKEIIRLKEEVARKAEDKYHSLFNAMKEGFCLIELMYDENGKPWNFRYLEVNPAFKKHTGIEIEYNKTVRDYASNVSLSLIEFFAEVARTGNPAELTYFAETRGKWFELGATRFGNADMNQVAIVFNDITERKKREQQQQFLIKFSDALRAEPDTDAIANRAIKMVAEHLELDRCYVGIALLDDNRGIFPYQFGNERVPPMPEEGVRLSDFPDALRKTLDETLVIADFQSIEGLTETEKQSFAALGFGALVVANVRKEEKKPDWSINAVSATPRNWTDIEIQLIEEVTERTWAAVERAKAEEALRISEEQLRKLAEQLEAQVTDQTKELISTAEEVLKQHNILKQAEELADAGSWEYNVKTKEFLWSDGMYRLFNIEKGKQIQPKIYEEYSLENDLPVAKKIVDAIEKTFEPFEEVMRIKFDGSYRTLRIKAAPFGTDGEIEKMLGVDLDITANQRSEEEITGLNKSLQAMNDKLSTLNAELKNFNKVAANNYSESLRHVYINLETIVTTDARNLSNSSRANLRRAQAAIQKMKLLTNDINNYLELYDLGIHKEWIDPNNVIHDLKEKMQKRIEDSNTTINISSLPHLLADPLLFSKLLHNIIDNSIKFRKPDLDPVIEINHSLIAEMNSNPKAMKNNAYTTISIKDNGAGINNEDAEKIFELFTQLDDAKHKGSGIGLAACKKIMEMHGGFITAESEPGKGTSVHCYFPA